MNTNEQSGASLSAMWRYGVNSAPASLYPIAVLLLLMLIAGAAGGLTNQGAALVGVSGDLVHRVDDKIGETIIIILAAAFTGMTGYIFQKASSSQTEANITPVFPGALWALIGVLALVTAASNIDTIQSHVAASQARGAIGDGQADMLFAVPGYSLAGLALVEALVLVAFFVRDLRAARSGSVDMDVTSSALDAAVSQRSQSTVDRTALETRDTLALQPKRTFNDLAGNEELKAKLLGAARAWESRKEGKNGIFMHGEPGTGKTAIADALAGEMGLKIMKINVGSMASRWVNQTTMQLQDIIDSALRQAPCMLFLDEVEAIFPDRSRMNGTNSEEAKVVGSFLSSIEKLRDGRVLLVAATNYKDRVDQAVIREGRFDFHIEVPVPDAVARRGLILGALKKHSKTVEPAVLGRLVRRWGGFNVPRIWQATERAVKLSASDTVDMADFMRGLREVQGNSAGVPETALGLNDLYFDDDLKARLTNLAATFAKSDEIEARGGSVPKGVIFYGPPGTGKTTMAQALAKAAGWTFITTSGKEILADADKLAEIRRKASDLRPSIVFIDEGDDILGDRRTSGMKLHTNDLLRTIDGAGEPLHDVVWILATNDIDGLDEAVIRRFPTKIELPIPSLATITRMVGDWAAKRPEMIPGDLGGWVTSVGQVLDGHAPSVVKNILDAALNTEAANSVLRGEEMSITVDEVRKARAEMRA